MDLSRVSRDVALQIITYNNSQLLDGKVLSADQTNSLISLISDWVIAITDELWSIYELSEDTSSLSHMGFKSWLLDSQSLGMLISRRNISNKRLLPFDGVFNIEACKHLIEFRLVRQNLIGVSLQLISKQI